MLFSNYFLQYNANTLNQVQCHYLRETKDQRCKGIYRKIATVEEHHSDCPFRRILTMKNNAFRIPPAVQLEICSAQAVSTNVQVQQNTRVCSRKDSSTGNLCFLGCSTFSDLYHSLSLLLPSCLLFLPLVSDLIHSLKALPAHSYSFYCYLSHALLQINIFCCKLCFGIFFPEDSNLRGQKE